MESIVEEKKQIKRIFWFLESETIQKFANWGQLTAESDS